MFDLNILSKIATKLDSVGLTKEADVIDKLIVRTAQIYGAINNESDFLKYLNTKLSLHSGKAFNDAKEALAYLYEKVIGEDGINSYSEFYAKKFPSDKMLGPITGRDAEPDYEKMKNRIESDFASSYNDIAKDNDGEMSMLSQPAVVGPKDSPKPMRPINVNWNDFKKSVDKNYNGCGTQIYALWLELAPGYGISQDFNSFNEFYKWSSKKEGRALTPSELCDKDFMDYKLHLYSISKNPMLKAINSIPEDISVSTEMQDPTMEEFKKGKMARNEFIRRVEVYGYPKTVKTRSGKIYNSAYAIMQAAYDRGLNIVDLDSQDMGALLDDVREERVIISGT